MARISSGVTLQNTFEVLDPNLRTYSFSFPVQRGEDVAVTAGDTLVSSDRYEVTLNEARTGGFVRFLDTGEAVDPVSLAVGETLIIQRNTEVSRGTSFGRSGYASAVAAEANAALVQRILEELAERLIVHADIHLTTEQVAALLGSLAIRNIADGVVGQDQLDPTVRRSIDDKIESGSPQFDEDLRLLTWVDGSGEARSLTIPGGHSRPTRSEVYTLLKAILTEGVDIDFTANDTLMQLAIAATGGGMREGFLRRQEPTGVRTAMTLAGSTAGGWGPWTNIATLSAITAEEEGQVILTGEIHGIATDGSGGGDRVRSEARIARTRGADTIYPSDFKVNGPRRLGSSSGTSTEFAEDSNEVSWELVALDSSQEGDVYTSQVRVQQQATSGAAVPVTFAADSTNKLSIASLGGPRGARGAPGEKGDAGAGSGSANEIEPLAAVPATVDHTVNDIINVLGVFYKLVDDAMDGNILRATSGAGTNYRGVANGVPGLTNRGSFADPAYQGAVLYKVVDNDSLPTWRAYISTAVMPNPPAQLNDQFVDERGETVDIVYNRTASGDVAGFHYYASGVDESAAETPAGDKFQVSFFTDTDRTAPQKVHSVDRWEELQQLAQVHRATEQEIYDRAKAILVAGGHTTIVFNDDARTITINEKSVGTGTTLPADPKVGDRFILLTDTTVPVDPVRTTFNPQVTLRQVALNGGTGYPEALRGYTLDYSGPSAATRRGAVFLVFNGARQKTANRVWYYGEGQTPRSYQVEPDIRTGLPNQYLVTGLSYADFAVGAHHINVGYTDGTKLNPDQQQAQGHYIYKGGAQGWVFDDGIAAWWAVQGQPKPVTLQAVTELGPGNLTPGLSIVNSSADARSGLTGFSPAFDLDDENNRHGVIIYEATVRMSLVSKTSLGFDSDTTNPLRAVRITAFAFANVLRGQSAYLDGITDAVHGTVMGEVVVRDGAATLGTGTVYMSHDNGNVVGRALVYNGSSSNATFTLTVENESIVFLHNDGPGEPRIPRARGRLVGRTNALPETNVPNGTELAVAKARTDGQAGITGDYGWLQDSISADARADGYNAFGPGSLTSGQAGVWPPAIGRALPFFPPANAPGDVVFGLQYRTLLDGVYVQTANVLWGPGVLTDEGSADITSTVLYFRGGAFGAGDRASIVAKYRITASGYPEILLEGNGTLLPAGCVVEVYELQV